MYQKPKVASSLSSEIERVLSLMSKEDPESEIYNDQLDRLSKLHQLKVAETKSHVSRDTWVLVGSNLISIILILQHERTQIIPRTAMNFVKKIW